MRIEIEAPDHIQPGKEYRLRALLFNDSYERVVVYRNAFIGPGIRESMINDGPKPLAVEPTYGQEDEGFALQPFTFYGRERLVGPFPVGEVEVIASYLTSTGAMITGSKRLNVQP